MEFSLPRVYPITDKRLSGRASHLEIVRELVRGGASVIQIRDKETGARELLSDIRRCVEHAAGFGVRIIVNDRCDLALLSGAAGVHLGQEDLHPASARLVLGEAAVLGLSTSNTAQIETANHLPVQYLGFGPIFPTATKPGPSPVVGLEALQEACRNSTLPIVAIGGIELEQIPCVLQAGAASAAVISTLMRAQSLARRMEELIEAAGGA